MEDHLDFVPGEFFVKIRKDMTIFLSRSSNIITTGIPSLDRLNREFSVQRIEETFLSVFKNPKNPDLFESIGLDRIYTFYVNEEIDILDAVKAYDGNPYVEYAEPNGIQYTCVTPNDPIFSYQWGLHNDGTYPLASPGKLDADIDAPEAWDIEKGDSSIVIAIIDSGIFWQHTDLANRIWINYGDPINGIDDDGNGFVDDYRGWDFYQNDSNPEDKHYHGTFCAGIAGASTNNGVGIAGVDWNCQLMALRAGYSSYPISLSSAALMYAADMGVHVISMSIGGSKLFQEQKDAIDYAYGSGCVIVAAAGNLGYSYIFYPARFDNVISVGMTDQFDVLHPKSNHGPDIEVVAPGRMIWSTHLNHNYDYNNGTSFSTPMVAGLAALLLAQDSTLSQIKIREIIRHTAEDQIGDSNDTPGWDNYYGYGRINAYKALSDPYKPNKPSGTTQGKTGTSYPYSTSSIDPNGGNVKYGWDWDGDDTVDEWDDNGGSYYPSGATITTSHVWGTDGTYNVKVKAKDINDDESVWSETLPVTMPKNKAYLFNFPLFSWLFERFPKAFPILRQLIG